jgi:hypothetical protein
MYTQQYKRRHCGVSMATVLTPTHDDITLRVHFACLVLTVASRGHHYVARSPHAADARHCCGSQNLTVKILIE